MPCRVETTNPFGEGRLRVYLLCKPFARSLAENR
jgi:hypothetical protein